MSDMKDLELSVNINGNSGIQIEAILGKVFDCVEFSLKGDVPQAVFISPWMQFEPTELNKMRQDIAYEIVKRVVGYEELTKQVKSQTSRAEYFQTIIDKRDVARLVIFDMWRKERKSHGLPDDFSDITDWPEELRG